jgi:MFS family permease
MNNQRSRSRLFIGWWMVITSAILTGLGAGFVSQGISVFFKPLAAELGLSRAATSLATGIARLQGGIEGPLTGWLCDRYSTKWVIVSGTSFVVAGLALMYFADSAWQYYIFWGVMIGIGQNLGLTIAIDKALSDWFIARRGLAFGIRFAIIGAFQIAVVPIVTWLVLAEGWHTTCLIWAGVMSLGIPLTMIFMKSKRPEYYGLLPDGFTSGEFKASGDKDMLHAGRQYAETFEEREFTVRQAVRTRAFWLMIVGWSCTILVMSGFTIHVVPFLTDMGISETVAGAMLSMMIFCTIPSRFFAGFLADRVPKNRLQLIAATSVFLQGMGLVAFLLHQSVATAYVLLILFGFGNGAVTPVRLSMGGRFFGRKAFASILGIGMFINAPLGFFSPIYAGWIFDTTGSYSVAFLTFAALLIFSSLVLLFIRPPSLPQETSYSI